MTNRVFNGMIAVLMVIAFLLDLSHFRGWPFWNGYLVCILLADRWKSGTAPWSLAALSTALTVIGFTVSFSVAATGLEELPSRVFSIALFWLTAGALARIADQNSPVLNDLSLNRNGPEGEQVLNEYESQYKVFVDHASDAFFVFNNQGMVLDANRQAYESLGRTREELIGQFPPFFAKIESAEFLDDVIKRLNKGEKVSFFGVHRHRDNSEFPVEIRICPFQTNGQKLALGIARNITDRKKVDEQNRIMERIATGSPLSEIFELIVSLIEDQVPNALCSILQYDARKNQLKFGAGPRLPAEYNNAIDGVVAGPKVGSCGTAVYRREAVIAADVMTSPLWENHRELAMAHGLRSCWSVPVFSRPGDVSRDDDRRVLGTFAIYKRDPWEPGPEEIKIVATATYLVSVAIERDEDIRALKESEERYRALVDHAPVGVCVSTMDEGTVIEANDIYVRMTGYPSEEIVGSRTSEFGQWPGPVRRDELIAELKKHGSVKNWEVGFRRKDGSLGSSLRSCERLELDGKDCILTMVSDMTARKEIDEELRFSRQRLEVLSRQLITTQETERQHLARELHDEISQIMTAIKINLSRTQKNADPVMHSALEENVLLVDQAISQVRNLSLSLRPPQLDQLGLVAALHWIVKHQARIGSFEERLDVDIGDLQISDDIAIVCFRVTQEALTNAIRHARPRQVHVNLNVHQKELYLTIEDDGVGFDVNEAKQKATRGQSLGLLSMQERVNLVGGRLTINSKLGHGTRIQGQFPIEPASCQEIMKLSGSHSSRI